jgi:hypothetical protein
VRQDWEPEDRIEVWTLLEEDQERLRNKSGANRLGFALLLKVFEVAARFPEDVSEIPVPAVSYVAQQVKVPAEEFAAYDWAGRAIKRHRLEIRAVYDLRECTEGDQAQLAEWLSVELCGVELFRDRARRGGGGALPQGAAGAADAGADRPTGGVGGQYLRGAVLRDGCGPSAGGDAVPSGRSDRRGRR